MSVEFLVKLHDAGQLIADAANDYLETMTPKQSQQLPDFDTLTWEKRTGTKGEYEQTSRRNNKVDIFDRLEKEIRDHGGFWQHGGFKHWVHQNDPGTIHRRRFSHWLGL